MLGYNNKILRVNLSDSKIMVQDLPEELAKEYIGGRGFAAKILWDELDPGIDPLGPENKLIFSVGPLNGTTYPISSRFQVSGKSPLTGLLGRGNSGGSFAPVLKLSGFDAIVFEGKAKEPVYLWVHEGEAELVDATDIWGKGTYETEELIREEVDEERAKVVSIGPAGENVVKFSCLIHEERAAARTGLGAVMGSKNLKALVCYGGERKFDLSDEEKFSEEANNARRKLLNTPYTKDWIEYGTRILVDLMSEIGRFPTKNFQTGMFHEVDEISVDRQHELYKTGNVACSNCPYACKDYMSFKTEKFGGKKFEGLLPEYETFSSLGSRLMNSDLESIIIGNRRCDDLGIDTISTGGVIGYIMELQDRGIISPDDIEGVNFEWGDEDLILDLIEKIAHRKGVGNVLAEGISSLMERFGDEAKEFAMQVKGMDIPAQDGRAHKSMGLSHVTSTRGADHLTSFEVLTEAGAVDAVERRYGKSFMPEGGDRLDPKYKGFMVKESEDYCSIIDSLVLCKNGTIWPPGIYFDDLSRIMMYATGHAFAETDLKRSGERILNLERVFNIREGLTGDDDKLPRRFTEEGAPEGPCEGEVVELEEMLGEYREMREWDENGLPSRGKLEELGLEEVAEELEIE